MRGELVILYGVKIIWKELEIDDNNIYSMNLYICYLIVIFKSGWLLRIILIVYVEVKRFLLGIPYYLIIIISITFQVKTYIFSLRQETGILWSYNYIIL